MKLVLSFISLYYVVVLNISYDNKIDTIYGIKVNKYEPSVIVRQLTSIAPLGTPQRLPQNLLLLLLAIPYWHFALSCLQSPRA